MVSFETPVLALAIDEISKVDGPDALCCLLTLFSKCKEGLQDGPRLENMAWRLWQRERKASQVYDLACPDICSSSGAIASPFTSSSSSFSAGESGSGTSDEESWDHLTAVHDDDAGKPLSSYHSSSPLCCRLPPSTSDGQQELTPQAQKDYFALGRRSMERSLSTPSESRSTSLDHRPLLASRRTHSNTSVGKIMADLIPDKFVLDTVKKAPSVSNERERWRDSSSTLATSTGGVPSVNILPEEVQPPTANDRPESSTPPGLARPRFPTVVILSPTPHPTPPMTPQVSPQPTSPQTTLRLERDNLAVPSRASPSPASNPRVVQVSEDVTSSTLQLDKEPVANGIANSNVVGKVNTIINGTGHGSMQQQPVHSDRKFFIARHPCSPDGNSPDTSASSQVGSHSMSVSTSIHTASGTGSGAGGPGTSAASGMSGVSGVSQTSIDLGQGQGHKGGRSQGSTSVGSGSGSDVLRMRSRARKGKDNRYGHVQFARGALQKSSANLRLLQQQPQPQLSQHLQQRANRCPPPNGIASKTVAGRSSTSTLAGRAQSGAAGPSSGGVKSPRSSEPGSHRSSNLNRRRQQQQQPQPQQQQQNRPPTASTGSPPGKHRIEIANDDSSEYETTDSDESWVSESVEEGDGGGDGDNVEATGLLNEAVREAQRQADMFAKVPRRSYTNLNRSQSGLLTSMFHPNPELFPINHPYRHSRSSHDILAYPGRMAYSPAPLQNMKGAVAGPVAAAVTAHVSASPGNARSKLRLKGCPEVEMEESDTGDEDVENAIQMSGSLAAQKLAALGRDRQSQNQQQRSNTMKSSNGASERPVPFELGYPYNLPPPMPPSTPRTTRRNMLTHELPESLRRNLLWERQVSRPTGQGARRSSALNNAVRPLTTVNGTVPPAAAKRVAGITNGINGGVAQVNGTGTNTHFGGPRVAAGDVDSGQDADGAAADERRRRAIERNRSWADDYHTTGW